MQAGDGELDHSMCMYLFFEHYARPSGYCNEQNHFCPPKRYSLVRGTEKPLGKILQQKLWQGSNKVLWELRIRSWETTWTRTELKHTVSEIWHTRGSRENKSVEFWKPKVTFRTSVWVCVKSRAQAVSQWLDQERLQGLPWWPSG